METTCKTIVGYHNQRIDSDIINMLISYGLLILPFLNFVATQIYLPPTSHPTYLNPRKPIISSPFYNCHFKNVV